MAYYADDAVYAGGGGDYTTLDAFEAAYDGEDLTGTDGVRARVKGNPSDGATVYWLGWQSGLDSTTRIVIEGESGYQPDGVNDASGDDALTSATHLLYGASGPSDLYIDFNLLESNKAGIGIAGQSTLQGEVRVTKCVFRDNTAVIGIGVMLNACADTTIAYVGGCLFKNYSGTYGVGVRTNDATDVTVVAINNTFVSINFRGIYNINGTITAKNNALADNGTDISGTVSETTNKSQDDGDITFNDADDFTEPSTEDFTVYDTNSNLYQSGTSIADSWFTTLCATDFAGTSWAGTPSVGCFEFSGGGATSLNAASLSSFAQITAPTLQVIRALNAASPSSATQITAPDVDAIRLLSAANVAAASQVTAGILSIVGAVAIALNAQDISSNSQLTAGVIQLIRQLSPSNNVSSASTITPISLQPIRALTTAAVESNTSVTPELLTFIRALNAAAVASDTSVAEQLMSKLAVIAFNDVSSASALSAGVLFIVGTGFDMQNAFIAYKAYYDFICNKLIESFTPHNTSYDFKADVQTTSFKI